jgi:AmmeMemoRadiSam system protein B
MVIWTWSFGHGHQVEAEQDASRSIKVIARQAAVAGSFYPADPDRLRRQVTELLVGASATAKTTPKAVIAPHAGYAYSGQIAAAAFATLRDGAQRFARVVVIGPAHYVAIRGIAPPTVDAFETPLGRVPVDRDAVSEIADLPFVLRSDAAHAPEHALEVELPFLQIVLPSFSLVPARGRRCGSAGGCGRAGAAVEWAGNIARRQFRSVPLSQL